MDEQRIKEVFSDEAFVKGLFELETTAEVQTVLKDKGVDIPESEIAGLKENLVKLAAKTGGDCEMPLNQLDNVAGGKTETVRGEDLRKLPRIYD